jgi:hypothetical protein|tara:strand:- start:7631 stop:7924 length:294 start_codon:yes stop_codon:yes gene_type:complete
MVRATGGQGQEEKKTMSIYTFDMKKKKEEPKDPREDPAYDWGYKKGEELTDFLLSLAIMPFVIWGAWNLAIPALFGLPAIGWVQSAALFILSRFLVR